MSKARCSSSGATSRIGAEWILVEGAGALIAGSAERPFKQQLHITLCSSASDRNAHPAHPQLGSKFLAALDGGTIDLARRGAHVLGAAG